MDRYSVASVNWHHNRIVVAPRIVWLFSNRTPELESGPKLEHLAARTGHLALYTIMVILPITGYLGSDANTEFFFIFEITKFESTQLFDSLVRDGMGLDFKTFERPMYFLHKIILEPWLVWVLIFGHNSAAPYHHIVKKNRTLLKITAGN